MAKYAIDVWCGNLKGPEGNAFVVMGNVARALRKNGVSADEIDKFYDECKKGDYEALLQTCKEWVNASWSR